MDKIITQPSVYDHTAFLSGVLDKSTLIVAEENNFLFYFLLLSIVTLWPAIATCFDRCDFSLLLVFFSIVTLWPVIATCFDRCDFCC